MPRRSDDVKQYKTVMEDANFDNPFVNEMSHEDELNF